MENYKKHIPEIKLKDLKKSVHKYYCHKEQIHNAINIIEKIIIDKNYRIIFDNSITNPNGYIVNAKIERLLDGTIEIRINPNSKCSIEYILIHEITHAIETDNIKKLIMDYVKKHSAFNKTLESLKQIYRTTDISSEVVANISGQLLGNQEFINNLSMKQPNISKRIYNSIISLANKITRNYHKDLFIKDLKAKWESAYRTQNNNFINAFSIQQDINGNRYVNVDTDQEIFEGKNLTEQIKIAKKYILDNFKNAGLNHNDKHIDVNKKTANEYTYPKNNLQKSAKISKIKASTELNNLLEVSKYKFSAKDDGRHKFAKDGWDYYETTFKVENKIYTGLINIAKNGNKKMLYDITNLKRNTQISSPVTTATESIDIPFPKDNIPQSNNNVNFDTLPSTKYSTQEKENKTLYDITNLKEVSHIGALDKSFSESVRPPLNSNTLPQNSDKINLSNK